METSLLGRYHGERPPAPAWFEAAIAIEPERFSFPCDGVDIEMLTWGEPGRPGLLFLHGDSAHADWWSFIAPFFCSDWRCAAISWSGMGGSGWRPRLYEFADWKAEVLAAIDAASFASNQGVLAIAHSMGAYPALGAAAETDRLRGVICIDSTLLPDGGAPNFPNPRPRPQRIYPRIADALARFRFMPETLAENHYIVDHIARRGLIQTTAPDGTSGWRWRFDPEIWANLERAGELARLPRMARCPTCMIFGGASSLILPDQYDEYRRIFPENARLFSIPEAGHHVMVDQPLALVAALRACLSYWP